MDLGYNRVGPQICSHGSILALALSQDGKLLASGGDDCHIRIWSVTASGLVLKQSLNQSIWGPITVRCDISSMATVIALTPKDSISTLAYDSTHRRLALAGLETGMIRVFVLSKDPLGLDLQSFTRLSEPVVAVNFAGSAAAQLAVHTVRSGTLYLLDPTDCSQPAKNAIDLNGTVGVAALSNEGKHHVIFNMTYGYRAVHRLTDPLPRFTMDISSKTNKVSACAFAEGDKAILSTSDHGSIYVFNSLSGARLQVLEHAPKALVQAMTAIETRNKYLVVTGSSTPDGTLCLWEKDYPYERTGVNTTNIIDRVVDSHGKSHTSWELGPSEMKVVRSIGYTTLVPAEAPEEIMFGEYLKTGQQQQTC
ncbi:WD40-repeat-containing domain protein [Mycena floridula]|nr:WD40-repeat-containing domain protein [Mycena floridula]